MIREHEPVTVAGVTYPSPYKAAVALSLQTGIPEGTIRLRIRRGYADKWILHPGRLSYRACTDHTGREFRSVTAMCQEWKIDRRTWLGRVNAGWSLERSLTEPPPPIRMPRQDHTGRVFPSAEAMCVAWGQTSRRVRGRLLLGWTLERALTAPGRRWRGGDSGF